jgi:hypothetical protein
MSYNTSEIIKASLENVEALNKKLNDIETLHNQIKESIAESAKIPGFFKKLSIDLQQSTEDYLGGNNKVFKEKISDIKTQTTELSKEILRLEAVNFDDHFNAMKEDLLKSTREALKKELDKLDEKNSKFQRQINDLNKEINRLTTIDLESHFEKHQNKLSEVFNAVNGINGTFTTMLQNIIKITQSLGDLEQQLKSNHKEVKGQFENIISELDRQKEFLAENFTKIDTTFENLKTQNNEIKTEMASIAKKQLTNTYITWALIVIGVITIIVLNKN